jgi:hypothetical protein
MDGVIDHETSRIHCSASGATILGFSFDDHPFYVWRVAREAVLPLDYRIHLWRESHGSRTLRTARV